MSAFTDLVLSLNPTFFGVLYDPIGSTVITDLSPNNNDGTYQPTPTFGLPSPIETDAASSSVGGVVGQVPGVVTGGGNQTWIGFTYFDDALAGTIHLVSRKAQFGLSNGVQNGINGGVVMSDVTLFDGVTETFYRLTDPVAPVAGNFYMIATVRNSTVHRLHVNDRLAASRSDLTTDDVAASGLPWFIGRAQNTSGFPGLRTSAVIFFDYALSEANLVAIYEASQLAIFITGRSDANPTAILRSDFEPDPVSFPWRHNWAE